VIGLDHVGDGSTLSSTWSMACPGQYRPHGDGCCDDTPPEHAGTLSLDGGTKAL
jgi:hypothetical protein